MCLFHAIVEEYFGGPTTTRVLVFFLFLTKMALTRYAVRLMLLSLPNSLCVFVGGGKTRGKQTIEILLYLFSLIWTLTLYVVCFGLWVVMLQLMRLGHESYSLNLCLIFLF